MCVKDAVIIGKQEKKQNQQYALNVIVHIGIQNGGKMLKQFCDKCGFDLRSTSYQTYQKIEIREPEESEPIKPVIDSKNYCSTCGGPLGGSEAYCPTCGMPLNK